MDSLGYILLGLVSGLIAVFFWVMVIPNGPTGLGVTMTIVSTAAAVVLLLIGCVGAGVSVGRKD